MLAVVIFLCIVLISCNAFYSTDETEEKIEDVESELKKEIK